MNLFKRYEKNPIIAPNPKNDWESLVTCNPGAWYDEKNKEVIMLYRAAGNDDEHFINLGLAKSKNGFDFVRCSDKPVLKAIAQGLNGHGPEDPRIVKFGDWYYVASACRPIVAGKYWEENRKYNRAPCPPEFPEFLRENYSATYLYLTKDFKDFIFGGCLTDTRFDNRDVIIFPEKINGRFAVLHRPIRKYGSEYRPNRLGMSIAFSDDLLAPQVIEPLAEPRFWWEAKKIGGSTPPLKTPHGWLELYHGVDEKGTYRVGALMLDLNDPRIVLHRTPEPIFQPEADYETSGFYTNVVFPCGNVVIDGTFFMYYGGADKFVGVATCDYSELINHVMKCPA